MPRQLTVVVIPDNQSGDTGQPGLQVHVARQEGVVVSGLRVSRIGETAVIWCMATAAARQRSGFGRRLLSAAIAAGGSRWLFANRRMGEASRARRVDSLKDAICECTGERFVEESKPTGPPEQDYRTSEHRDKLREFPAWSVVHHTQAYSHSASVGRRCTLTSCALCFLQNFTDSSQLTQTAG